MKMSDINRARRYLNAYPIDQPTKDKPEACSTHRNPMDAEAKVKVWKLERVGLGGWLAVGANALDAIYEEIANAEPGEELKITVEEWDKAELEALPEFDGW